MHPIRTAEAGAPVRSGRSAVPLSIWLVFFACALSAQDERRVVSPDGQVEFRLFIATQRDNNLSRIAYEVFYHGKPLIVTSFLGLDIQDQEPLLGENVGLTSSTAAKDGRYNTLVAKYMQNGSLGRLINVEARAYNDGVTFRYVIPPSTPLMEVVVAEEATEFRFAKGVVNGSKNLPVAIEVGPAWVAIGESEPGKYPAMRLAPQDPRTELTRLKKRFDGAAPLVCPWRVVAIGGSAAAAVKIAGELAGG